MIKTEQIIDCVMPAAGLSSRMGQWKLMLPYRGQTILDQSIENALSHCSRVILVVGYRSEELRQRYQLDDRIVVVINADYQQGMFSSIQCGVALVNSEHFFICHGDMPCISSATYQRMWRARGQYTLFPGNEIKPGHPVLLPPSLISSILHAQPSSSMKALIMPQPVRYLQLNLAELYLDVDTPEAYQRLLQSYYHSHPSDRYQSDSPLLK
ncbi:MAG: molybdenum cofactor cytidylyltransferase [Moritella sp.]|jgi:molybdenum cofactor cytidylyltransferase